MSNRLFQGIVHQMKDAIDRTIGVIDETSVVIACSELGKIGEVNESVNSETLSSTAPFVVNGYTYRSFGSNAKYDYAVFVQGTDEYAQKYAQLLSVSFASIKQYYDEKYDRNKVAERHRDHALFIAFAPAEAPQIAVAVMVENGESGSGVAAPVAKAVMDAWLLDNQGLLKPQYASPQVKAHTTPHV